MCRAAASRSFVFWARSFSTVANDRAQYRSDGASSVR
jgi:hypothetical protein